jgi:dTDP-glucose 4,6-dehydratase
VREELGWRPEQSFEEGLRMTVEWYLNNPDWYRPLIDDSILSATPWRVQW